MAMNYTTTFGGAIGTGLSGLYNTTTTSTLTGITGSVMNTYYSPWDHSVQQAQQGYLNQQYVERQIAAVNQQKEAEMAKAMKMGWGSPKAPPSDVFEKSPTEWLDGEVRRVCTLARC